MAKKRETPQESENRFQRIEAIRLEKGIVNDWKQLASELNAGGILTPSGGGWTAGNIGMYFKRKKQAGPSNAPLTDHANEPNADAAPLHTDSIPKDHTRDSNTVGETDTPGHTDSPEEKVTPSTEPSSEDQTAIPFDTTDNSHTENNAPPITAEVMAHTHLEDQLTIPDTANESVILEDTTADTQDQDSLFEFIPEDLTTTKVSVIPVATTELVILIQELIRKELSIILSNTPVQALPKGGRKTSVKKTFSLPVEVWEAFSARFPNGAASNNVAKALKVFLDLDAGNKFVG